MTDNWEKELSCALACAGCEKTFDTKEERILSVYTHQPICMACKAEDEQKPDFADVSKTMISQCIQEEGKPYGDPAGYCFHHFCPFKC